MTKTSPDADEVLNLAEPPVHQQASETQPFGPSRVRDWTGVRTRRVEYPSGATIFAQGEPATSVMYLEDGGVRLSVLSRGGTHRTIAVLHEGAFFGEGCLAGQLRRMATARTIAACQVISVDRKEMVRQLHTQQAFTDGFLAHMLKRNIRGEEDLLDQMLNRTEKRLARTLLLLAGYGGRGASRLALPRVSQEVLAEMVGTNRSRINYFMNKFRKLGLIDYNGGELRLHSSLLRVVLSDSWVGDAGAAVMAAPTFPEQIFFVHPCPSRTRHLPRSARR